MLHVLHSLFELSLLSTKMVFNFQFETTVQSAKLVYSMIINKVVTDQLSFNTWFALLGGWGLNVRGSLEAKTILTVIFNCCLMEQLYTCSRNT